MPDLVDLIPAPLRQDIERGHWLPVVGAGLSRNAHVPHGDPPPDWGGLAKELSDPEDSSDAVDLISSYSQEHGRPALVERIARAIRIADAVPGAVHHALCRLPVDVMVTTNFDTLLEDAFRSVQKPCHAILDEPQLALNNPFPGPALLKIHGDISRPERMVLTEADFDSFLIRNPLYSTIIASHFAQRSAVLIGYSLSDPDLRQLLAMIRDRLGDSARALYSLEVDPPPAKVARFGRRNVKVISLPGDRSDPAPTIQKLFDELFAAIGRTAPSRLVPKTHESALVLRASAPTRGCFLSAPFAAQPDYYEWLAPIASSVGVTLLNYQDYASPGGSFLSVIDSMLAAAGCAIVEYGSQWTAAELGMATNRLGVGKVLLVQAGNAKLPEQYSAIQTSRKPSTPDEWAAFGEQFKSWLVNALAIDLRTEIQESDDQMTASIIRLAATLEYVLGERLNLTTQRRSLGRMIPEAHKSNVISGADRSVLTEFVRLRNSVAHGQSHDLTGVQVDEVLWHVRKVIDRIRDQ